MCSQNNLARGCGTSVVVVLVFLFGCFFFFLLASNGNDPVKCGLLENFIDKLKLIQIERIIKLFCTFCSGRIVLHDDWYIAKLDSL